MYVSFGNDESDRAVTIRKCHPNEVLAALHESAEGTNEYVFAARDTDPNDLILVAWEGDVALGYIATTDLGKAGMLIWEHLVVPARRTQGLGRRLLLAAARRANPQATLTVDPMGELDLERVNDYYRQFGFRNNDASTASTATAAAVVEAIVLGTSTSSLS